MTEIERRYLPRSYKIKPFIKICPQKILLHQQAQSPETATSNATLSIIPSLLTRLRAMVVNGPGPGFDSEKNSEATVGPAVPLILEKVYELDPALCKLNFTVSHLKWTDVNGVFTELRPGTRVHVRFASSDSTTDSNSNYPKRVVDSLKFLTAARVGTASIDTQSWLRDRRMRNEFLEADRFPDLLLKGVTVADDLNSKSQMKSLKSSESYSVVKGVFEIRGIEKEVELKISEVYCDSEKNLVHAVVEGVLDRFEFDILSNWPTFTVGQEIKLRLTIVGREVAGI